MQAIQLTVPVPVLGNRIEEGAQEASSTLGNLDSILEALRPDLLESDNTVALVHLGLVADGNLGKGNRLGNEINRLASSTDSLEVTERLTDPVKSTTILGELLNSLGATGDEDGVNHGRAETLEVVVGLDGRAVGSSDLGTTGTDHKGNGQVGRDGGVGSVVGDVVVTIGDEDSNAARLDGGSLGRELSLAEVDSLLAVVGVTSGSRSLTANHLGNGLSKTDIDIGKTLNHAAVDNGILAVVKLEAKSVDDVVLLNLGHGVPEELGLAEVLLELGAAGTSLDTSDLLGVLEVAALLVGGGRAGIEAVGVVVDGAAGNGVAHGTITVEVHDGAHRAVDGKLLEVDTKTGELGIEVGEVAALEKRVVGEANAGNDVAGAEGDLLGLGEELVGVAVELHLTNVADGNEVLGPDLGGIENIEVELVLVLLGNGLDTELPLGIGTVLDSLPEILAVEVRVLTSQLQGLIPNKGVDTELGSPDELDKVTLALGVDEGKGVDTETLHHAVGTRNGAITHGPGEHVSGLGVVELEIPEVVVRSLGLGNLVVRLGLASVDDIGELDGVLDEENGNVVADKIPVTLLSVELGRKTTDITNGIGGTSAAEDGGEAHEDGGLAGGIGKDGGECEVGSALVDSELAKGTAATGVDYSLWDSLVVEAHDLEGYVSRSI